MLDKIEEIKKEALQQLDSIGNVKDMEAWRVQYLGKKSPLTQILRSLGTLSMEEKKAVRRRRQPAQDLPGRKRRAERAGPP